MPPASAAALCHLIQYDCVEALLALVPTLRAMSDDERVWCLRAHGNAPALYRVMCWGHPDTIRAFGQLIEGLPPELRAELLMARHANGMPGFHAALRLGRSEIIGPFCAVVRCCMPADWHYSLLRAADASGTSALHASCAYNDAATVRAFIAGTKELAPSLRVSLLMARSGDGECGLALAAKAGFTAVVNAYRDALQSLPSSARVELLRPASSLLRASGAPPAGTEAAYRELRQLVLRYAPALVPTDRTFAKTGTLAQRLVSVVGAIRRDDSRPRP